MYTYFKDLFYDLPFITDDVYGIFAFIFTLFVIDRILYIIQVMFTKRK